LKQSPLFETNIRLDNLSGELGMLLFQQGVSSGKQLTLAGLLEQQQSEAPSFPNQ
jgi:uncharacterized protein (DUF2164 family)